MAHIELRELHDDDLDAIFEMMRDPDAVTMVAFTASDPDDREVFDAWISRERSSPDVELFVVTERGGFAGTAALFTVDGDREVTCWIAHHAWGRGVATEALRLLTTREPIRPLFARAAVGDARVDRRAGEGRFHRGVSHVRRSPPESAATSRRSSSPCCRPSTVRDPPTSALT